MAELLTRVNYGLVAGNFEMDLDDGEIRYKTALALGGTPLTEPLFDGILSPNLMAMQRYLPALRDVAAGRLSPVEAVALVEGGAPLPG